MKVLYGIPTTGYGHVIRSKTIIEELSKFAEVDVLLSGAMFGMEKSANLPNVKYVKQGIDFSYKPSGQIEVMQSLLKNKLTRIIKETIDIDLTPYDFVISDSEPLTCMAAKAQNKKCLGISNLYAYLYTNHKDIRILTKPIKQASLKFIGGDEDIVVFYDEICENGVKPVISKEIQNAAPQVCDKGHITVYLGTVDPKILGGVFNNIPNYKFEIFSPSITNEFEQHNVSFKTRSHENFVNSLVTAHGFITAAGFTATSEALFLGKKMMIVPINHIEQKFNAKYLKNNGVKVIKQINENFVNEFDDWENNYNPIKKDYANVLPKIIAKIKEFEKKPQPEKSIFKPSPFELLKFLKYFY